MLAYTCAMCGKELVLPFTCKYCGESFCAKHRLPENHNCPGLPMRSWAVYKTERTETVSESRRVGQEVHRKPLPYFFLLIIMIGLALLFAILFLTK